MLSNALVKSIFRCKCVEKQAKNMLPKVRVTAGSKLCCPLASFRPQRIPNLASRVAVSYDTNLTVHMFVSWFRVENKNGCCSTPVRCQKLRFVVTAAFFGAHHLRRIPCPLGQARAPVFWAQKANRHVRKNQCVGRSECASVASSYLSISKFHSLAVQTRRFLACC